MKEKREDDCACYVWLWAWPPINRGVKWIRDRTDQGFRHRTLKGGEVSYRRDIQDYGFSLEGTLLREGGVIDRNTRNISDDLFVIVLKRVAHEEVPFEI